MNIIGLYGKLEYLTESKLEEDIACHDSGATLFVDGYPVSYTHLRAHETDS